MIARTFFVPSDITSSSCWENGCKITHLFVCFLFLFLFCLFLMCSHEADLKEEEGECVPDEGGRHVHRPEDARVPSDRRRVGVVGQQVSLGDKK